MEQFGLARMSPCKGTWMRVWILRKDEEQECIFQPKNWGKASKIRDPWEKGLIILLVTIMEHYFVIRGILPELSFVRLGAKISTGLLLFFKQNTQISFNPYHNTEWKLSSCAIFNVGAQACCGNSLTDQTQDASDNCCICLTSVPLAVILLGCTLQLHLL